MIKGELTGREVVVWGVKRAEEVYELGCYGKVKEDRNTLSLCEALHLSERKKLSITEKGKKLSKRVLYKRARELDDEFPQKYAVYKDLRGRGLLVKTGFKFGTHFRVYGRGVVLRRGPKEPREHTKWVVYSVPEGFRWSFTEFSRFVRMAQTIRATPLLAVVDEEGDVTYYSIRRIML